MYQMIRMMSQWTGLGDMKHDSQIVVGGMGIVDCIGWYGDWGLGMVGLLSQPCAPTRRGRRIHYTLPDNI